MRSQTWWYVARSGGIVAWALASLAVIVGLQLSTRLVRRAQPAWLLDVHRFLGGLAVAFLGVHLLGLAVDDFIGFGLRDFVVPFVSSYKPVAVGLGVIAMYLLLAVEVTSLAMRKLPRRTWYAIHLSSYVIFVDRDRPRTHRGHRPAQRGLPVGVSADGRSRPHDDAGPDLVAAASGTRRSEGRSRLKAARRSRLSERRA